MEKIKTPLTKGWIRAQQWYRRDVSSKMALSEPESCEFSQKYDKPIRIFRHSPIMYAGPLKLRLMKLFKRALSRKACLEEHTYPLPVELLFGLKPGTFSDLYRRVRPMD